VKVLIKLTFKNAADLN